MPEEIPQNNFEQEVAQISQAIERKRNVIERENGIVEEQEVAKEAIREAIQTEKPNQAQLVQQSDGSANDGYLSTLDETHKAKINELVTTMREKGIKQAVQDAQEDDPYLLDAFHDTLVDTLYDELKEKGYI